jgi:hypothetical protein
LWLTGTWRMSFGRALGRRGVAGRRLAVHGRRHDLLHAGVGEGALQVTKTRPEQQVVDVGLQGEDDAAAVGARGCGTEVAGSTGRRRRGRSVAPRAPWRYTAVATCARGVGVEVELGSGGHEATAHGSSEAASSVRWRTRPRRGQALACWLSGRSGSRYGARTEAAMLVC